ncbi:MAG: TonB-dependent receptor [Bacteroidia bacterium]|nr:TonB-dependent receptor [Bacteroidia bacterium]
MIKNFLVLSFIIILHGLILAQNNGIIEGRVINAISNEPVPFANVVIWKTNTGTTCDIDGKFVMKGIQPAYIRLAASSVGFETALTEEILVTNQKHSYIEIRMNEKTSQIKEVDVQASPVIRSEESPVSLRTISITEIEKNPGSNRDVSKIIQSYPGVSSGVSYRNDLIIRGGGPSENRFYLDDVEIPNLNHFATQGSSGGPVGIINADFIREVNFWSGAFPANKGNALSSVIDFMQIDGNPDKTEFKASVGASDLSLSVNGPISSNSSYIFSVRRSYLQFLFSLLQLPFLPTYNDYQFKARWRLDPKNELSVISIGALDHSGLNTSANKTEYQQYLLNNLPVDDQWTYTIGLIYKHFDNQDYHTFVFSRNYLNNSSYKYKNNIEADSLKLLDYSSDEAENKFRYESTFRRDGGLKINYSLNLEYATYFNRTWQKIFASGEPMILNYRSDLDLLSWGSSGQISKEFFGKRLIVSGGIRADANNYSNEMSDLLKQLSPRISLSWSLNEYYSLNFNTGRYYERPAYTTFGYRDSTGMLVNKANHLKYIYSDHLVGGIDYHPDDNTTLTLEGFYKHYGDYPFSVKDSVALANKGTDFGVVGDESVTSTAEGKAYGAELFARISRLAGFNTVLSYTLVRSLFTNVSGEYIPSAWDNVHLVVLTATRWFKHNWQFGFKWRFTGGTPYTPYNEDVSGIASAWDARGQGYFDYSRFNTLRLKPYHQLDIRIDKEYYFQHCSLNFYVDIQNLYDSKSTEPDIIVRQTQLIDGKPVPLPAYTDPTGVSRYPLKYLDASSGSIIPSLGVIFEF